MFSLTLFLTRLLSGLTLLYITIGCLLFYREFLYNATAMGLPLPVPAGLALVVAELFLSLLLMLGWFTRPAAGLAVLSTAGLAAVFLQPILINCMWRCLFYWQPHYCRVHS